MKPNIIVASHSGYCMGVKRAFAGSFEVSQKYKDVCIFGEMVHNKYALKSLEEKGIAMKKTLEEIVNDPDIKNVIIRAHGIPPEEKRFLQDCDKTVHDFTCPKVRQVQQLTKDLSKEGYTIILFGKSSHPEVKGILGYCTGNYYVIKNYNEAIQLPMEKIEKPVLLSQTTMNSDEFEKICKFLKTINMNIRVENTLCKAPIITQVEALAMAKEVDAMIVVGDKMSANTTTLFEKLDGKVPTWFIETVDEVDISVMAEYKTIGITGGSSTPEWQIKKIKEYIENSVE